MKIALIATYPPEECGIATFTRNLADALTVQGTASGIDVIAVNKDGTSGYPEEVKLTISQHQPADYSRAADYLNSNHYDLCILQHEYGIFGGESGVCILSLVSRLQIPFIMTAHTVLKKPSVQQRTVMKTLAEKAAQVIVMTSKARQFLRDIYEIPAEKISIIEHGVPSKINIDKDAMHREAGLEGKTVLMTFGLLGRNKGIETVIHALPGIVSKHPEVIYVVQGNTHPNVIRSEGESYRESLVALAAELGVSDHVQFRKGFLTEEKLFELLHSVDVYITPYHNEEQITSGTLSYALGAGAAIVSTPYWHAQELLADNRGWIFNFRDHGQLSDMVNTLLEHPDAAAELRTNALAYAHHLRWKNVGKRYLQLIRTILDANKPSAHIHTIPQFAEPGLRHIARLTDNIGMFQHAIFGLPNYHEGYCLDDNARALMAMTWAAQNGYENDVSALAEVYLSFIHFMQQREGGFHNFLSFDRRITDEECSEDAYGRTLWALGMMIASGSFTRLQPLAEEIFIRALHHARDLRYIRGMANTMIGLSYYLEKYPFHGEAHYFLNRLTEKIIGQFRSASGPSWNWFEDTLTYDNGILPLALFHAHAATGNEEAARIALDTTAFLEEKLMKQGYLSLVGSSGWYPKGGIKSLYPQQAIDAMSMVLLFNASWLHTGNPHFSEQMMNCYRWFFFENDLGLSLYDYQTQGCYDGLEDYGINKNQGAESTLAVFISHYVVRNSVQEGRAEADAEHSEIKK